MGIKEMKLQLLEKAVQNSYQKKTSWLDSIRQNNENVNLLLSDSSYKISAPCNRWIGNTKRFTKFQTFTFNFERIKKEHDGTHTNPLKITK